MWEFDRIEQRMLLLSTNNHFFIVIGRGITVEKEENLLIYANECVALKCSVSEDLWDFLQFGWQFVLGMFVLKVLLVGLGISWKWSESLFNGLRANFKGQLTHLRLANAAADGQSLRCSLFLRRKRVALKTAIKSLVNLYQLHRISSSPVVSSTWPSSLEPFVEIEFFVVHGPCWDLLNLCKFLCYSKFS